MPELSKLEVDEPGLLCRVQDVIRTGIAMDIGPKRSRGGHGSEEAGDLLGEGDLDAHAKSLKVRPQLEDLIEQALHFVGQGHSMKGEGAPEARETRRLPYGVGVHGTQTGGIQEQRPGGMHWLFVEQRFH